MDKVKRVLCALLAIVMIAGMVPVVHATEARPPHPEVTIIPGEGDEFFGQANIYWSAPEDGEYPNNPPAEVDTVEEKVVWIADQCRAAGVTDPWEIALWLHNWLIYNANYDYTYSRYGADGVLLDGTGVCNSYMLAFGLLLDEFGIENMNLVSIEMNHGWNLVKLNGQWCHVDCTWDDPGEGGSENFTYFGMDDELMGRDHTWDRSYFPACTSKENYYLIRKGYNVFSNKAEMMMLLCELAEARTELIECYYIGLEPDFPIIDVFREWYNTFAWKYGLRGYGARYTKVWITARMNYGSTGSKPYDFDEKHTHAYVEETVAATCAQKGKTVYTCCCGHSYEKEIAALDHTVAVIPAVAPTCTATGLTEGKYCSVCNEVIQAQVEIPVIAHQDGNGDFECDLCRIALCVEHKVEILPAAAPTCTVSGLTEGKRCSKCGAVLAVQEEIPALQHQPIQDKAVAATCTTAGVTEGSHCGRCNIVLVPQTVIPAKGHQWQDATCKAPKTCAVCRSTSGKKASHTYNNNVDGTCNFCEVNRETVENRQVHHMFRMYNPNTGEHFYTGSEVERDDLIEAGWQYEGVGFTFPKNTGAPVHRLFQPSTGEHLYTMDEAEKDRLLAEGWNYEGVAFNSAYDTEAVQHRLHNPNEVVGAYHFTFSEEEKQNLINAGWEYQGIGWYSCWK